MKRTASCSCGNFTVEVEGEPVRISMCHCLECQKRTGSIFGVQARWPLDKITVRGESKEFVRKGDSGGVIRHRFCPTCGATMTWEIDTMPGVMAVAVGAFADPSFPPPRISVYGARRHPWAVMPNLEVEELD